MIYLADPNRSLSNLVGSMKNPPTAFFTCSELYSDEGEVSKT